MEPLLQRLIASEIRLETRLAATGAVEIDPTQLEQVLLNLTVNASDAMADGGTLTIQTDDRTVTRMVAAVGHLVPVGNYCVLAVRDTGTGMSVETLSHVFEPFFTTKEPGRGTGLGLATVFGIVEQAGGHIAVTSELGLGTIFELYLPRLAKDPVRSVATPDETTDLRGNEVILLVEDEAGVRAPICRTLRQLGYFVLEAKHGGDALTILQEYHAPVHLVITDVVMPEMSGPALIRLLHSWYPRIPVLFVSGYSEELVAAKGVLSPNSGYLAKPFTGEQLAARVREILDRENAPEKELVTVSDAR
jgi:CheY-like chemotaxis protein